MDYSLVHLHTSAMYNNTTIIIQTRNKILISKRLTSGFFLDLSGIEYIAATSSFSSFPFIVLGFFSNHSLTSPPAAVSCLIVFGSCINNNNYHGKKTKISWERIVLATRFPTNTFP